MRNVPWTEIATELKNQSNIDLTEKQAKDFVKESLSATLRIIKGSKGKILVKNCDVQQFYKDIPFEELKIQLMDINETQTIRNKVRIY